MLWARMLLQWSIIRAARVTSQGPPKDQGNLYLNPRGTQVPVHLGIGTFSRTCMFLCNLRGIVILSLLSYTSSYHRLYREDRRIESSAD